MKKIMLMLGLMVFAICSYAQTDTIKAKHTVLKFKEFYENEQADSIYSLFSAEMKAALPLTKIPQMITQLKGVLGPLQNEVILKGSKGGFTAYVNETEKSNLALRMVVDKDYQLCGLLTIQATNAASMANKALSADNFNVKTLKGTIYGTLALPDTKKPVPVVLIIAGSGPTDRNGNSALALRTNSYLKLAEELGKDGIATLRYDKRGIGASTGAMKKEENLRFEDYVNDALLIIKKLKSDKRFSKVIVAGHSEGSFIGILASGKEHVNGFISLAGAGKPINKVLAEQLKVTLPDSIYKQAYGILDTLKRSRRVKQSLPPSLEPLFHASIQPYLISWMKYDPRVEIKKLTMPVCIIQGTTDIQVSVKDAELLKKARPNSTLVLIEGMNHILKAAPADRAENIATYNQPDLALHPELLKTIEDFINKLK